MIILPVFRGILEHKTHRKVTEFFEKNKMLVINVESGRQTDDRQRAMQLAASYSYLKSKTCEYETRKYLQFKSLIVLASKNSESHK